MSWKPFSSARSLVATTLAATAAATVLAACAHRPPIEGARKPPEAWVASSTACADLSGTYAEIGAPGPQNSTAFLYTVVWPNFASLVSFIEHGTNGVAGFPPRAHVHIDVDEQGHATFRAFDTAGNEEPVKPREWWCENGALVTRGPLNPTQYAQEHHQESLVRLWKAHDGALIAENTFREVEHHFQDSKASHDPFARFYFRFAALPTGT